MIFLKKNLLVYVKGIRETKIKPKIKITGLILTRYGDSSPVAMRPQCPTSNFFAFSPLLQFIRNIVLYYYHYLYFQIRFQPQ